jgi:hypothetical protein
MIAGMAVPMALMYERTTPNFFLQFLREKFPDLKTWNPITQVGYRIEKANDAEEGFRALSAAAHREKFEALASNITTSAQDQRKMTMNTPSLEFNTFMDGFGAWIVCEVTTNNFSMDDLEAAVGADDKIKSLTSDVPALRLKKRSAQFLFKLCQLERQILFLCDKFRRPTMMAALLAPQLSTTRIGPNPEERVKNVFQKCVELTEALPTVASFVAAGNKFFLYG